ncbi:MAG: HlyD family efflux transporter periplasmic adaptor subunit [Acetobacteraceae bacterium]|nr:HlyD family efflux transporter periplasmic adaptor subunit [Acetobacteraceae bacterium]
MSQRQSLFRQQAVDHHRRQRHWGEAALPRLPGAMVLFYVILLAATLIVIFLFRVHYARKETVSGYLAPSAGVVRVYAPRPGTISAVHAEEGQVVSEGQALLTVSVDQTASDGANVDASVLDALARQKALLGERITTQERLEAAEQKRLEAQISGLDAEMAQIEVQVSAQDERARLSASRASAAAELSAQGVLSGVESKLRREAYLEQRRSLAALAQDLVTKRNERTALRLALEQLPTAMAEKIQLLRKELLETEQRIAEIEGRRAYVVRAPVGGRISALQAAEGHAADPRQPQLSILPDDGLLHAELFVPTRAAGFVRPGQEVRILYDAFPYQRFGAHRGRITMTSQTVLMPGEVTAPVALHEPVYRAVASLERQDIASDAESTPLRPDMLLRAEIVLERRPLIAWLLGPLLQVRLS